MVKVTTKRGTAVENVSDDNFAGQSHYSPKAQERQKKRLQLSGANTTIVTKRGTDKIEAKDIPYVPQSSLKGQKITTKRGTSVKTL
jgi:hypothetical protein|tara:strand:+ start:93 stop:350 length:258 start_codon:yes stop_codon:yes gene_type:complete